VQYSLLDRRAENGMAAFCAERGIRLLPYGTTAGGLLSDKYLGLPAGRCGGDGRGRMSGGAAGNATLHGVGSA
jgi:aryl-alcohol dehydrogenase-like predicted oxidoreductase